MHAVHLLRKFNPAEWGGTETAIQRLVVGLQEAGVTPIVYCPRLEQAPADDPLRRSGCRVERFNAFVPVLGLSAARKRDMVAVGGNLMSFDLLRSLWREPDISVIHAHTLGRIGGIALTVAKQRQLPFVVTIHGGVFDLPDKIKKEFNSPMDGGWEWGKFFGLLFQSHRLFRDADAIVTCNPTEAALLRERYPDKQILVQPHGVPVEVYRQDQRAAARTAFPQICGREMLLNIGRLDPIKNQGWLLEQMPALVARRPGILLVLAGACTHEQYGREIRSQIQSRGLTANVLLTGGLPPEDPRLIGLFQEAKAVVLPSVSETFGLVILEAWAAGRPVLSSRTSGALSLVRDGHNGWLFDLSRPEEFHSAIDETLANPGLAAVLAQRGAELVKREFSISVLAYRLKCLYEELIEERSCAT